MTQKEALNILKAGRNVYLTGAAGSGKTFVLNEYISYLKSRGVSVAVTASTGIAATHIGGTTIHSWSGIGIKNDLSASDIDILMQKEYLWKRYDKTKVLIIDEVSMLSAKMFDALNRLTKAMKSSDKPFGGMQVVLSGDFFQLPPIARPGESVQYIDSSEAWQSMDIRVCYLEEQHRQESTSLANILNEIRSGEISVQTQEIFQSLIESGNKLTNKPTRLHTHNVDVDTINEKELAKLSGEIFSYQMETVGKASVVTALQKNILAPETLKLKVDAVVMFVKNSFEEGYMNGTLGRITGFEGGMPVVETYEGKKVVVTDAKWEVEDDGKVIASASQLPLRLAWAITVHKSQGMSLDSAEIDLSRSFVPGQGYVALSRLRSLDGLSLLGLNNTALAVDPYVLELNNKLMGESDKWRSSIAKFSDADFEAMHREFISKNGGTNNKEEIEQNKKREAKGPEPKIPSHEQTLALILEGNSLEEISNERGMTIGTIIGHLEKLKDGGYQFDIDIFEPDPEDMAKIKKAFGSLKEAKLTAVHKKLKGKYSFDELRLARLFL